MATKSDKLKFHLYVKFGKDVIKLPKDVALLMIALNDLKRAGYKGDLYTDTKLTKSIGTIDTFL